MVWAAVGFCPASGTLSKLLSLLLFCPSCVCLSFSSSLIRWKSILCPLPVSSHPTNTSLCHHHLNQHFSSPGSHPLAVQSPICEISIFFYKNLQKCKDTSGCLHVLFREPTGDGTGRWTLSADENHFLLPPAGFSLTSSSVVLAVPSLNLHNWVLLQVASGVQSIN